MVAGHDFRCKHVGSEHLFHSLLSRAVSRRHAERTKSALQLLEVFPIWMTLERLQRAGGQEQMDLAPEPGLTGACV